MPPRWIDQPPARILRIEPESNGADNHLLRNLDLPNLADVSKSCNMVPPPPISLIGQARTPVDPAELSFRFPGLGALWARSNFCRQGRRDESEMLACAVFPSIPRPLRKVGCFRSFFDRCCSKTFRTSPRYNVGCFSSDAAPVGMETRGSARKRSVVLPKSGLRSRKPHPNPFKGFRIDLIPVASTTKLNLAPRKSGRNLICGVPDAKETWGIFDGAKFDPPHNFPIWNPKRLNLV